MLKDADVMRLRLESRIEAQESILHVWGYDGVDDWWGVEDDDNADGDYAGAPDGAGAASEG